MLTITELREKRNRLITQAREALEEIKTNTDEARAKELEERHDKFMAEYDALEATLKREERLAQIETETEERNRQRRPGLGDGETSSGDGKVDQSLAFRNYLQYGTEALNAEERTFVASLRTNLTPEMRAQSLTAAAGGYTVPQGFSGEIDKALKAYGPMFDPAITRVLSTDSGNDIPWPTMDDTAQTGALLAENTQSSQQDITFGSVTLKAYMYTSKGILVSYQLLQDSAFDVQSEIIDPAFGERIGRIANAQLTTGTGSSQPNGIVTASTLGKTTAGVAAVTADEIIDFYHSVDPAYRSAPKFRVMFNDSTLQAIRKLKDAQNRYLIDELRDNGATLSLAGISVPYSINQDMASMATGNKFMLAGDFNRYVVRKVRDYTILRLVERYADFFQVGFFAFARLDGNLINIGAVKHMKNA